MDAVTTFLIRTSEEEVHINHADGYATSGEELRVVAEEIYMCGVKSQCG